MDTVTLVGGGGGIHRTLVMVQGGAVDQVHTQYMQEAIVEGTSL